MSTGHPVATDGKREKRDALTTPTPAEGRPIGSPGTSSGAPGPGLIAKPSAVLTLDRYEAMIDDTMVRCAGTLAYLAK